DLVTYTLANDLALKLGERQQYVECKPSHTGRGGELLGARHERDTTTVEDFHQLGKIRQRPRQSVDLVDDQHIDLICLDVVQQALQRRPFHRTSRIAAVIILGG